VNALNAALSSDDQTRTARALSHPALGLYSSALVPFAAWLYHSELRYVREGSKADLRYEGVQALTEFLTMVAEINLAVEKGNADEIWQ